MGDVTSEGDIFQLRVANELIRRGQTLPIVPKTPPLPTEGARLRCASSKAIDAGGVGAGILALN